MLRTLGWCVALRDEIFVETYSFHWTLCVVTIRRPPQLCCTLRCVRGRRFDLVQSAVVAFAF